MNYLLNVDKNDIVMDIPKDAETILKVLEDAGYQAYVVGGCVRDTLLERMPGDWDITTSALPQQVKALFKKTIDTGIKHGTVTIMQKHVGYEVTTYRIDGNYADGRHPDSVEFSVSLVDDLKRRDFTINAMAYNPNLGLVDEFDGIEDLKKKIIRCVGDATERFTEDALRMMRAVRFSAQLGFDIDRDTYLAIMRMAPNIKKVSMERIHDELGKILLSDNPDYVKYLSETGLMVDILPVIDKILKDKKAQSTLRLLKLSKKDIIHRYAALFNNVTYEEAMSTLSALKLDNNTIKNVSMLVKLSKKEIEESEPAVREMIHLYGRELVSLLIEHKQAVLTEKEQATGINMLAARKHLSIISRMFKEINDRGDCISVKDLKISGNDLMELGIKGPKIGETLNKLLYFVMENPELNDKQTLLAMIEVE